MKNDDNEEFTPTPLEPLDVISEDIDEKEAQWVLDALELHMRRHGVVLAVVGTRLDFVNDEEVAK